MYLYRKMLKFLYSILFRNNYKDLKGKEEEDRVGFISQTDIYVCDSIREITINTGVLK